MHLLEISTVLFALTKVTYAWGTPQQRPPAAWTVSQGNQCGNGVTPYCCNNEAKNGGYTDCTAMGQSDVCSTTIVCCNANESIQSCIGSIKQPPPPVENPTTTEVLTTIVKPTETPTTTTMPTATEILTTTMPTTTGKQTTMVTTTKAPTTTVPTISETTSKPTFSPIASTVVQANQCGNGVRAYCCNNDALKGGEVNCSGMDQSSICDTTIVCCNADHSIQVCVGNIIINQPTVTKTKIQTPPESSPTGKIPTSPEGPTTGKIPTSPEGPTTGKAPTSPEGPTTGKAPSGKAPTSPEVPTTGKTSPGPIASVVTQTNQCGNGVTSYCCNNEAVQGGHVSCNAMELSSICDTTIVCCNAEHSIQACVGNIMAQQPTIPGSPICKTATETNTVTATVTSTVKGPAPTVTVRTTVTEVVTTTIGPGPKNHTPTATMAPTGTTPTGMEHPTTTTATTSSCPTNLSGNYEYPHLIVPINSAQPNKAYGTSYSGTVSNTISTIFNFDIPYSDFGKTCSLIFLFPNQSDLRTSSYKFSGNGKIEVAELRSPATESTTHNNAPKVAKDLGAFDITPGNSYLISTFACPAGHRVGFETSNAGTTYLDYFQDYNPAPIGLYITTC